MTWRGTWRSFKGAKPRQRTPEQRSAELAGFADRDRRNEARRAARLAEPEPIAEISSGHIAAMQERIKHLESSLRAKLEADRAGGG